VVDEFVWNVIMGKEDTINFTDNKMAKLHSVLYDDHANIAESTRRKFDARADDTDNAANFV